jgi:N utilization substance protein B
MHRLDMPYRVVLNEGINLAKDFGADGSHRYVNGILDKVAQKQRPLEIKAKSEGKKP